SEPARRVERVCKPVDLEAVDGAARLDLDADHACAGPGASGNGHASAARVGQVVVVVQGEAQAGQLHGVLLDRDDRTVVDAVGGGGGGEPDRQPQPQHLPIVT